MLIADFRTIRMIKEFNALKRTNFKLEDFCTTHEIDHLKQYVDGEGRPLSLIPLGKR